MARREDLNDHGLEALKKAAFVPDNTYPSRYSFRTEQSNIDAVNRQQKVTNYDSSGVEGATINNVAWKTGGGGIDKSTNTLQQISYEHHEIHAGSHFYICGFEVLNLNAQANFGFETPNTTVWTHIIFDVSGSTETEFYIYEGAVYSGGTARVPMNNNRNSANVAGEIVSYNPTITSTGTLIFSQSKGKEQTNPSAADNEGLISRDRELILKQGTKYVFRIISKGAGNNVSYCGEWYSHQDKN